MDHLQIHLIEETKEAVFEVLRQHFRPEFLNRVDETIMFQPLSYNEIKGIVQIQLNQLKATLAEQNMDLEFTDYALQYFAEKGYDPQFGARPLKRLVQK